jgi:hypothetical protein
VGGWEGGREGGREGGWVGGWVGWGQPRRLDSTAYLCVLLAERLIRHGLDHKAGHVTEHRAQVLLCHHASPAQGVAQVSMNTHMPAQT